MARETASHDAASPALTAILERRSRLFALLRGYVGEMRTAIDAWEAGKSGPWQTAEAKLIEKLLEIEGVEAEMRVHKGGYLFIGCAEGRHRDCRGEARRDDHSLMRSPPAPSAFVPRRCACACHIRAEKEGGK